MIVGPDKQVLSTGFNGFCRGVDENDPARWERPTKYDLIEHAERNAVYNAARHGVTLRGSVLYLVGMGPPTAPCVDCSRAIIQSGITDVFGYGYKPLPEHWEENCKVALKMLAEADVRFREVEGLGYA